MKITAYVPCRNGQNTLPEVLGALRQQTRPADQFLFIDDHCTDQSPAIARENAFDVVPVPGQGGLAAGRNVALGHATGDVLLGIDADVVLDRNFVQEMEKKFAENHALSALCGRLDERFKDTPADLWRAVHMPQHHGSAEVTNPPVLFGATSACRLSVLNQLGGWNEQFRTNSEDLDLTRRLSKAGFSFLYAPTCQAWHVRRDTPHTVLRSFWNWNNVDFDHHFMAVNDWVWNRLLKIWEEYRRYKVMELAYPTLRPVTLLFSFVFVIRDLAALQHRIPDIGHIPQVAAIAAEVVAAFGMPPAQCAAMSEHLAHLATELNLAGASSHPLHPQIAYLVRAWAQESIPDVNYWRDFQF
jgi:GT2 family glycosyltransferase